MRTQIEIWGQMRAAMRRAASIETLDQTPLGACLGQGRLILLECHRTPWLDEAVTIGLGGIWTVEEPRVQLVARDPPNPIESGATPLGRPAVTRQVLGGAGADRHTAGSWLHQRALVDLNVDPVARAEPTCGFADDGPVVGILLHAAEKGLAYACRVGTQGPAG